MEVIEKLWVINGVHGCPNIHTYIYIYTFSIHIEILNYVYTNIQL